MTPLDTLLIFVRRVAAHDTYSLSTHNISLTEYEKDEDAPEATASVWIYPKPGASRQSRVRIDDIVCQTPEFASAIGRPVVKNLHNAWRVDFKLQKGCIPGLVDALTTRQKLCAANLRIDGEQNANEVLWLSLNDRRCQPVFEAFNLVSEKDELAQNIFKYQFDIVDPDNTMTPDSLVVSGIQHYALDWISDTRTRTRYHGMLTIQASCSDSDLVQNGAKITVGNASDMNSAFSRVIQLPMNCPPLVSTPNDQTDYTVEENTRLTIPLRHDPDVKLSLNAPFGALNGDNYVWDAACRYGKGPHLVEILGTSANRFGKPLQLAIQLTRCLPRFNLLLDGGMIQPETPVSIEPGQTRRLRITSDSNVDHLQFVPQTDNSNIHLTESDIPDGYEIEIECLQPDLSASLRVLIIPDDAADSPDIPPIFVPIECIASPNDNDDDMP